MPFVTRSEAEDLTQQLGEVDAKIAEAEARILSEGGSRRTLATEPFRVRSRGCASGDSLVASQSAPYEDRLMVPNEARSPRRWRLRRHGAEPSTLDSARQGMADRVAAMSLSEVNELQDAFVQIAGLLDEQERKNAVLETTETRLEALRQENRPARQPARGPLRGQDPASLPVSPTEPNPWLIGLFSVLAGSPSGRARRWPRSSRAAASFSPSDIARTMALPVLGTVNLIVTRSQARRRAAARVAVGGVSATVVLFIGYVTWAWVNNQSLLSNDVLRVIEEFRSAFE